MVDSLIAYLGLMFVMMVMTWCGKHSKTHSLFWLSLSSIAFAVVMGIRYNVGTDFPTYYSNYIGVTLGNHPEEFLRWEWGFRNLMGFFAHQGFHYSIPFGIVAYFQIFLVYLGVKHQKISWIFIPLTLILSCIWVSYDNIMRHMLAFSIFVFSIHFLSEGKYLQYYFCVIIAYLFHNSAVILTVIPFFYFYKESYFKNIFIEFILLISALAIMNIDLVQQIFEALSTLIALGGYEDYLTTSFANFDDESTLGLGFLTILLIALILVIQSKGMKEHYNSKTVGIMFDLYFIGVIIRFAFARMFLFQRLNYYFYSFEFVIAALTLAFLYQKRKYLWFSCLIGLYFALFMGKMVKAEELTAAYQTFLSL